MHYLGKKIPDFRPDIIFIKKLLIANFI